MTPPRRLSDREIARLRRLARGDKPDETTIFEWFCAVCGQPFTFRGITEVCPTCEQGGIEHIAGGVSGA